MTALMLNIFLLCTCWFYSHCGIKALLVGYATVQKKWVVVFL